MKATAIFCVFLTFGDLVNIFKSPVVFKVVTLKTDVYGAQIQNFVSFCVGSK